MFKIKHGTSPNYLTSLLPQPRAANHDHNLRDYGNIEFFYQLESGLLTLVDRRRQHRLTLMFKIKLILMFKIKHGTSPNYLTSLLPQPRAANHDHNLRDYGNIEFINWNCAMSHIRKHSYPIRKGQS